MSPRWFDDLRQQHDAITHVRMELKRGRRWHEMSEFRYDVVVEVHGPAEQPVERWEPWASAAGAEGLRERLASLRPNGRALGFTNVPNARIARHVAAAQLLSSAGGPSTAQEIGRPARPPEASTRRRSGMWATRSATR